MTAPPTTGTRTRADYLDAVEAAAFAEVVTFDACTQLLHALRRTAENANMANSPRATRLLSALREEADRIIHRAEQRTAHNRDQLLAFDDELQDDAP